MTVAAAARPGFDRQGTMGDAECLDKAVRTRVGEVGRSAALHLASCVHCGLCAQACHFHLATGDPQFTPVTSSSPSAAPGSAATARWHP